MQMRGRGFARLPTRERPAEPMHEGIVKTLRSGSVEDKMQAILSIATCLEKRDIPVDRAQEMLCQALSDENKHIRWSAVFAMAQHGSRMIDGLRTGLMNSDPSVRGMSAAMICVSLMNDKNALRSTMMPKDERVLETSRDLLKTLLDPQPSIRMHALCALRELARRSPLETLDELNAFSNLVLEKDGANLELSCRLEMVKQDALAGISGMGGKTLA
ncbi:MAG: hypothetical protein V1861_02225 [Candidatus Micrarchaeota archaeon]